MSSSLSVPVSVLIPAYNAMPYLGEAVASVLQQTHVDFELLVVDDGSTDGTSAFLRTIADPRVRVLRQVNQGLTTALNVGLAAVEHELVARLDADDVMAPHRLERQVHFMEEHPEYAVVASDYGFINEGGTIQPFQKRLRLHRPPDFDPWTDPNIPHQGVLYRRSVVQGLGGYRELTPAEDYDLWLRVAEQHRLACVNEVLTHVRVVQSSITMERFVEQRIKWLFVKDSGRARRAGEREPVWTEWLATNEKRLAKKADQWRAEKAWRVAGMQLANGRWFPGVASLMAAAVAYPGAFLGKLKSYARRS